MHKNFVIIISGPTATGKSDFVLQLGNIIPIEIINADIGSFYTKLSIGTAKPDWYNQQISHHFFDILDDPVNYTAPQFRAQLEILIKEIWNRGNIPVIVGGSAFYIQSFFYKNHEIVTPDQLLVDQLEIQSSDNLWQQLNSIDPDRAEQIDVNDRYRLVRALTIWFTMKQKPSDFGQIFAPLAPFYFITLTRDRDQLYEMINQRVYMMMKDGWLNEVRELIGDQDWVDFLLKKKMIGYDLLIHYLQGNFSEQDLNDVTNLIAQRTRNYAKRQITFLKRLDANIKKEQVRHEKNEIGSSIVELCNLTLCDLSLYIKQLSERILQFLK